MTDIPDFAPVPPRPKDWRDVFTTTRELRGVPIEEIERGRVDWEYDFDTKDMRPCGRKGCEKKHAHGWIVALSGHRFVHIGNDCALKYAHAGLWASNVSTYKDRISAESRITALIKVRDDAQQKQHWLDNTPGIQPAINLYESFTRQARGPFLAKIEWLAERGLSKIERDKRLTVDELEIRRAMLSGARVEGEPGPYVAATERVTIGEIAGLECFRPQRSPRELHAKLQRLVTTLLSWSPTEDDRDAQRSLVRATRDLAPLSNQLNSSMVAVGKFFSETNLQTLLLLEVARSQGIVSIGLNSAGDVAITRHAHWQRAA
jgi:hypothetical protein